MSIFLDRPELSELPGYTKQPKQQKWLSGRGWEFEMSALGQVKVLRKYAEMQLGIPIENKKLQSVAPDFSNLTS